VIKFKVYCFVNKMSKSKGAALLLASVGGIFGADKFYIGEPTLGLIQMVLSLSIVGLVISIPLASLAVITLLIAIVAGGTTLLYPEVDWMPTNDSDIAIAILVMVSYIVAIMRSQIATQVQTQLANEDVSFILVKND
jgi:TM2 domain-containing membrane protein YozV